MQCISNLFRTNFMQFQPVLGPTVTTLNCHKDISQLVCTECYCAHCCSYRCRMRDGRPHKVTNFEYDDVMTNPRVRPLPNLGTVSHGCTTTGTKGWHHSRVIILVRRDLWKALAMHEGGLLSRGGENHVTFWQSAGCTRLGHKKNA